MADLHNKSRDTAGGHAWRAQKAQYKGSSSSRSRRRMELRNSDFLWLFYWGLPFTVNTIWANLRMLADSGEPKAMIYFTTSLHFINGRAQG